MIPSIAGIFLSQRKYITDLLHKSGMTDMKPASTLLSATYKLLKDSGDLLPSPTEYRALVGSLQYLSLTRLDIAFSTNKLAQFMQNPITAHWTALKRVLRYLAGSCDKGVFILMTAPLNLHAYSNADWAGDKDDYISTTGYLLYLSSTPISWSSQNNVMLLALPQKQNIKPWQTRRVSYYGSFPYSMNSATLQKSIQSSIVTTSVLPTLVLILYFTLG